MRIILALASVLAWAVFAWAIPTEVEWSVLRTLNLKSSPLDLAVTPDGQRTFVLLKGGEIQIYAPTGDLLGELKVDSGVDRIEVAPSGEHLLLSSSVGKTFQVVSLEFVQAIDLTGSPVKGPADAPVAVAVFSDFQ